MHSTAVLPLNCKFGKLYIAPTFTCPRSIRKEGVAGQGLFIKREGNSRKEGEEENKTSWKSQLCCHLSKAADKRWSSRQNVKRESHPSSADGEVPALTASRQDRAVSPGGGRAPLPEKQLPPTPTVCDSRQKSATCASQLPCWIKVIIQESIICIKWQRDGWGEALVGRAFLVKTCKISFLHLEKLQISKEKVWWLFFSL